MRCFMPSRYLQQRPNPVLKLKLLGFSTSSDQKQVNAPADFDHPPTQFSLEPIFIIPSTLQLGPLLELSCWSPWPSQRIWRSAIWACRKALVKCRAPWQWQRPKQIPARIRRILSPRWISGRIQDEGLGVSA